ncbi:hypothetical protein BO99DRAFT_247190 [Aspergillus violaceofuscus CBS 115571]|uniref:Uncharacterized protein n=1 Tax=Aspergillus violaceofuscus (strain CBS 115571) TaxID=1450538 RepID=A0A2V5GWX5_ASPV1|nr:hypothetical protein BO99DRAFT_247190 [Aspergillus violaceofuscus CBS 115571]
MVVVALAGRERLDAVSFRVNWSDGWRDCLGTTFSWEVDEEVSRGSVGEMFWAAEMLSRATSVTGAALDALETAGQAVGYQLCV